MTYIIDTDGVPCGYRLTQCRDAERSILVQSDWDFPGLALQLGWTPSRATGRECCDSGATDGTVSCPECGAEPAEFIQSAMDWIDEYCGELLRAADYPGLADYFEGSA